MNAFPLLPPTEKRKQFELRALALRDFAGVSPQEALDPFALAQFAKLLVVDFDKIKDLSDESREHLLGAGSDDGGELLYEVVQEAVDGLGHGSPGDAGLETWLVGLTS